jgi:hypothetical protein
MYAYNILFTDLYSWHLTLIKAVQSIKPLTHLRAGGKSLACLFYDRLGAVFLYLGGEHMDEKLLKEARKYGINTSMYCLLEPKRREEALRKDIERERKKASGQN